MKSISRILSNLLAILSPLATILIAKSLNFELFNDSLLNFNAELIFLLVSIELSNIALICGIKVLIIISFDSNYYMEKIN
jgi:hypothetical protein